MKIRWKKLVWLCLVMLLGVLSVKGSATHVDAAIIDSEGYTVINTVAEFDGFSSLAIPPKIEESFI